MGLRTKIGLAVLGAFALLPASAALASSVSVTGTAPSKTLNVTAADAEGANDFHVSRTVAPADFYLVSDSHTITFGAPCVAGTTLVPPQPAGTVACPVADIVKIKISGKDGNDAETIETSVTGTVKGDLSGGDGDDTLQGGATDDEISGGGGADVFKGGAGIDRADYGGHGTPTRVTIGAGTNDDGSTSDVSATDPNKRDDVQADVENVLGGKVDDRITGDADANVLDGAAGDDTLTGGGGGDTLIGGSGRDAANYGDHAGGVTVDIDGLADDGNVAQDGPGMDNVRTDIEKLYGSDHDDTLTGAAGDNRISGRDGNDRLSGLDGNDSLDGQAGNDTLLGGNGRDVLEGREGDDALNGGVADDVLNGGTGADALSGSRGNDILYGRDGVRDLSFRCGSGRKDRAVLDRRRPRDPRPRGCERVSRR